jgi:hypothetical protein
MKSLVLTFCLFASFISNSQLPSNLSVGEKRINTTVKIVGTKDSLINGRVYKAQSIGTGFIFQFYSGKDSIVSIVTALHVIKNCKEGFIKFNTEKAGRTIYGDIVSVHMTNFNKLWIQHPNEDLAILPLLPITFDAYKTLKKLIAFINFDENFILSNQIADSLSAIQQIIMIGYPKGFSDSVNNVPIARIGNTATPLFLNYNGRPKFLVDIPIYPGSSGSPIVVLSNGIYEFNRQFKLGYKAYLAGIAVESQEYIARGMTVSKDPQKRIETQTLLPFGIAIALKANLLLDFKPLIEKIKNDKNYFQLLVNNISTSVKQ